MLKQLRNVLFAFALIGVVSVCAAAPAKPNILFAIADDWGWPHAGAYGDPVVKTPAFDRIAREGVLFHHAYISSPSCTPSRNAILTGQYHWRLGPGANLWSTLDTKHATYPLLLEKRLVAEGDDERVVAAFSALRENPESIYKYSSYQIHAEKPRSV